MNLDDFDHLGEGFSQYINSFKHLIDIKLTYAEHFTRAISISYKLGIASIKTLIHAFYPDIFITSASDTVMHLSNTVFIEERKTT